MKLHGPHIIMVFMKCICNIIIQLAGSYSCEKPLKTKINSKSQSEVATKFLAVKGINFWSKPL